MGNQKLMLRAWWHDHHAGPSFVAAGFVVCVGTAFAASTVPAWGSGPDIPLWALVPGTISMLLAPMALSQLSLFDALSGEVTRQACARAIWATAVACGSGAAVLPVALVVGRPSVPLLTGLLVVVTFGLSAPFGLASAGLGGVVDVLALTYGSRIPWVDPWQWVSQHVPAAVPLALLVAISSLGVYGARGRR